MKVAILFSGQMRSLETTYWQYIKPNLFDTNKEHEIDVFVHTWFDVSDLGKAYKISEFTGRGITPTPVPTDTVDKLFKLYNPKKALVERQIEFSEKDYLSRPPKIPAIYPKICQSKCYSMKQVGLLKQKQEIETGIKYDIVGQFRFDLGFGTPLKFESLDPNVVTTSPKAAHVVDCTHGFMGSHIADVYTSVFYSLDDYWRIHGVEFVDENMLRFHLDRNEIQIVRRQEFNNYQFVR